MAPLGERPSEALGRFLRSRRESLMPEDAGLASRRGRRTPGLRREEVAFLADIGVKWYARLEAGHEIHPSETTLLAISAALRLSPAESEYVLELAGLKHGIPKADVALTIPASVRALLQNLNNVAAGVFDRIHTPLHWNSLEDEVYLHSRYAGPVERNLLVRTLFDAATISLSGRDREAMIARGVGMLRFNLASPRRSPFADDVYERVKHDPLFSKWWDHRVVSNDMEFDRTIERHHAAEGLLIVHSVELAIPRAPDLVLRILVPADGRTAVKFNRISSRITTICEIVPNTGLLQSIAPITLPKHGS